MLFNSLQFFVFFAVVYSLYLGLNHRWQNRMLLIASYVFYGAWDWRFLSLIWLSTVVDAVCAHAIDQSADPARRKRLLMVSITVNLAILGFFKYFNFFAVSLMSLGEAFGISLHLPTLQIVLPVGISFYTFQTMSYTIDIYYGRLKPAKSFWDFALFVAFFPQLVAGPIERARHLLPQIVSPRQVTLNGFYEGCYLIFWGLFQKVFVADNLARIADPVFSSAGPYRPAQVLLGVYAFAFQIFCDFSGYSNIARGLCRCLGIEIMVNFNLPYFARNPKEFWHRWHISLSTWLRDYLYIPLGGSRHGRVRTCRNLMVTMLLGGLWHGAAWTFVVWGAFHGSLLAIHRWMIRVMPPADVSRSPVVERLHSVFKMAVFFQIVCLGWLIFRAQSIGQIMEMVQALLFGWPGSSLTEIWQIVVRLAPYLIVLVAVQIYQFRTGDLMAVYRAPVLIRGLFYCICAVLMIVGGVTNAQDFIYFQF